MFSLIFNFLFFRISLIVKGKERAAMKIYENGT